MNRIILALDTTNLDEAIGIAKKIKNKIFTIKLGLEFFNAHGKEGVKKFNEIGITNLMLDLKLKDIPETVYKAIKALDGIQFGFLTIHGLGGKTMIDKAIKAAKEIKSQPKIMMVTILTALNDEDLKATGSNSTVDEQVEKLAKLAKETGVGIVCSGHEAKNVRKILGPNLLIFTSFDLLFVRLIISLAKYLKEYTLPDAKLRSPKPFFSMHLTMILTKSSIKMWSLLSSP